MQVTTKVHLDTRKVKKTGKYPVKLRVTFNREQRYYPYPNRHDQTKVDFALTFPANGNTSKKYKETWEVLVSEQLRAEEIIKSLGSRFSFTLFEKRFKQPQGASKNIFSMLEDLAKKLRENDQISTAVVAECALSSLKKFHTKERLSIDEIDVEFLTKYEKWMIGKGKSNATIGMYGRTLRGIYNQAIRDQIIPQELYPFKEYHIPVGRNFKKALSLSDVGLIYNYKPNSEGEARARDFWLLTYLCNGINMKDIALLKFKNIDGDMIRFERAKTKRANKDKPVVISFVVTPDVKRIISRWGNKSIFEGNYIFPILTNKCTAEEIYKRVYNAIKTTNKFMEAIRTELKITVKVRLMEARHSYATVIRNSGTSVEFISEALGHNSIETTKNYLAGFEDKEKRKVAEVLTNFAPTGTDY